MEPTSTTGHTVDYGLADDSKAQTQHSGTIIKNS